MTTGSIVVRVILGVFGAAMLAGGILLAFSGVEGGVFGALWLLVSGSVLIVVSLIEVSRYRSEAAERAKMEPGPGGGESAMPLEPRFQPTEEIFLDPTSQRRMRVYSDTRTGERRYVAEG